jgi:hypothetical protein
VAAIAAVRILQPLSEKPRFVRGFLGLPGRRSRYMRGVFAAPIFMRDVEGTDLRALIDAGG